MDFNLTNWKIAFDIFMIINSTVYTGFICMFINDDLKILRFVIKCIVIN